MTSLRSRTQSTARAGVLAVAGALVGFGIICGVVGRTIDNLFGEPSL